MSTLLGRRSPIGLPSRSPIGLKTRSRSRYERTDERTNGEITHVANKSSRFVTRTRTYRNFDQSHEKAAATRRIHQPRKATA